MSPIRCVGRSSGRAYEALAAHATDAVVAGCHEPVGHKHRFHAPVARAREDRHGHLRRVPRLARDAVGEGCLGRGCVPLGVRPTLHAEGRDR